MSDYDWSTITCNVHRHEVAAFPKFPPPEWKERAYNGGPYKIAHPVCSYCGSLHPGAMFKLLSEGATLENADWKYGWTHKFYVSFPNPIAGQDVSVGSKSSDEGTVDIRGAAPNSAHAKFYTVHLDDVQDKDAQMALIAAINKACANVEFIRDEKGVAFRGRNPATM